MIEQNNSQKPGDGGEVFTGKSDATTPTSEESFNPKQGITGSIIQQDHSLQNIPSLKKAAMSSNQSLTSQTAINKGNSSSTSDISQKPKVQSLPITQKSGDYLNAGAPKTSRFLKSLDSSASSFTTHHYNPYLYTQHKTRPNAPFDIMHIRNKVLISNSDMRKQAIYTESGLKYYLARDSVPIFRIPKEQLPDPITFYSMVEDLGEKYGAVKVEVIQTPPVPLYSNEALFKVPASSAHALPQPTSLSCFSLNTEYFWFKARKQYLNSFRNETEKKIAFHKKLFLFHRMKRDEKDGQGLGKIPSIDKRTLDLYRLRSCVQLRGGFRAVCQKKLWAQIGRELGYSGRIMSSLSTSLRSAYLKVFLEFDKYEEDLMQKEQLVASTTEHTEDSSLNGKPVINDTFVPLVDYNNTRKRSFVEDSDLSTEDQHSPKKHHSNDLETYETGGSSAEFIRIRDILRSKGFFTNFETITESRRSITDPDKSTLPAYDFSFWRSSMENYDKSPYELKNSPIYNLRQYHEKSQKHHENIQSIYSRKYPNVFLGNDKINKDDFEKLFFDVISDKRHSFDVDSGVNLPSVVHGSGFPTIYKGNENIPDVLDPWNLNNLALSDKSLLKFTDIDYGNHARTRLDVGMLFSVNGWSLEDNFLPMIDYNHLGSSKLWYVIPPEDLEKFEKLLKEINLKKAEATTNSSNVGKESEDDTEFKKSEFYHSFLDTNSQEPVTSVAIRTNSHSLYQPVSSSEGSANHFPSQSYFMANDIQLSPDFIRAHGIKLYKVTQDSRSFVIKFPKAYTTNIASGFHVSEKAFFAPRSWLKHALDGEKWLSDRGILPGLLIFQLLMNIVSQADDSALVSSARKILAPLIHKELKNRKKVKEAIQNIPITANCFDPISDENLEPTGASKILLTDSNDCFTISLENFLRQLTSKNEKLYIFGHCITDNAVRIVLHIYFSDETLQRVLSEDCKQTFDLQATASENFHDLSKFDELVKNFVRSQYKGERVPLKKLLAITNLFEDVQSDNTLENVRNCIKSVQNIAAECRQLLEKVRPVNCKNIDFGSGFDIKELPSLHLPCNVTDLRAINERLKKTSVEFPEMITIFQLTKKVSDFQILAKKALSSADIHKLKHAYLTGTTVGVNSKYIHRLSNAICEREWLDLYDSFFIRREPLNSEDEQNYSIDALINYLKFGIKYVDPSGNLDKLTAISEIIKRSQDVIGAINRLFKKKNARVPVKELYNILKIIKENNIPLQGDFVTKLENILKSVEEAKSDMIPIWSRLSTNDKYMNQFQKAVESKALSLELSERFNGSKCDLRISITEVQTKDAPVFSKHIKLCKSWLHDFNMICQSNSHMKEVLEANTACFDTTSDVYVPPEKAADQNLYCFCRKGDVGSTMVECEICKEWFHLNCINKGRWSLPEDENNVFVCSICHSLQPHNDRFIKFNDLLKLVISSAKLKVIPDREILTTLFQVVKEAMRFRNTIHKELLHNGEVRKDISYRKLKFYLRKLEGAKCQLAEEIELLKKYCKRTTQLELDTLKRGDVIIITGYERSIPEDEQSISQKEVVKVKEERTPEAPFVSKTEELTDFSQTPVPTSVLSEAQPAPNGSCNTLCTNDKLQLTDGLAQLLAATEIMQKQNTTST